MLVAIDESGDAGFKLEKGSSEIFAIAMVVFGDVPEAERTGSAIRAACGRLRVRPEFKFANCRSEVKEDFFRLVSKFNFKVSCLVVHKARLRSDRLKDDKDTFYTYFVRQLIAQQGQRISGARVLIDGSGERTFRDGLASHLRRAGGGTIKSVVIKDSRGDPLIQLADMCVGAIARSYRSDRTDAARWRALVEPQIESIWEVP